MRDQQEFKPGEEWDMPILNVFRREEDGTIRHFWASELLYVPAEPGQAYRHNDLLNPLWNMLDVTPEGLVLRELAPGVSVDDVRAATGPEVLVPSEPSVMQVAV